VYRNPDDAIRHLFKLAESMGSVQGPGEIVKSQDRCSYCGGPMAVHDRCIDCGRKWEPMPWYDTPRLPGRDANAHYFDDTGRCVMCRQAKDELFAQNRRKCVHGGINVRGHGNRRSSFDPNKGNSIDDTRMTLALCIEKLPLWQWRVYGIIHIGLGIGRRNAGTVAKKHWRAIPKHHATEHGARVLIEEGRENMRLRLCAADLMGGTLFSV